MKNEKCISYSQQTYASMIVKLSFDVSQFSVRYKYVLLVRPAKARR